MGPMQLKIIYTIYCLLILALNLSSATAQSTNQRPSDIRVETEKGEHHVDVFIVNEHYYYTTVTLSADYSNLKPDTPLPATMVFDPQSRTLALTFNQPDTLQGWELETKARSVVGSANAQHKDTYLYRLPFRKGEAFRVDQSHGGAESHSQPATQYAVDFSMPVGTPVYASREGVVVLLRNDSNKGGLKERYLDEANFIYIQHSDGTIAEYAHLKRGGVSVDIGQEISVGDMIGYSGNTGYSSGPHLHFNVFKVSGQGHQLSIPVRFNSREGIIKEPEEGKEYTAKR